MNTKINELKQKYLTNYTINDYNNIKEKISAYIDNELTLNETIKIKEILIKNHFAQKEYLMIMKLVELLKTDKLKHINKTSIIKRIKSFIQIKRIL